MKKLFIYTLLVACLSVIGLILNYYQKAQIPSETDSCNLNGKVIRITDGDSITVLANEKTSHKIRLAGIDAPERRQPYGKVARQFLAKHIFKKNVCIGWYKRDKYQRLVGIVRFEGEDINLKLIAAGMGWHYKHYQNEQTKSDRRRYAAAQETAEGKGLGLWRDRSPIPPWQWRRGQR